ncbi:hypothetical protein JOC94_000112 [Bacillus thermophilus]|uniref:NADH dehydrogenase subunit 5 n=1 Tax=Siminovitchia thermophila TaxID=1245522 RepID=A0ABS2R3E1_9BACI|nr:hypothetical protein [Siminovitchia thermophila]MBM7713146.1 hypothetical protein [Siminovitchia thermophila]
MNNELKLLIAMFLIIVPILLSIFFSFKSELLLPKGYDLALDGYVISKTMVMIFTFYLLTKTGFFILRHIKKD